MTVSTEPLIGRDLRDRDNRPAGKIRAIYRYPAELDMPWGVAAVVSGRLLRSMHLVDLKDADIEADVIRVRYERATITSAPHFIPLVGDTLSEGHANQVREHYA
ncbi:hypothetical protein [Asanoa iriomotensis]|uniref:Uncharacterized protein n=1 Tax=Asanoa iriomotensis TaxID=234613 RepID=A0ABQ4CD82_9ACTN|nr:hypothetical protein [Asanoa iriomotensis]GIF60719.1 hypothetical protein Air01nite_68140 [Asanoa iriomotensis]